jgi:hypothetical protein
MNVHRFTFAALLALAGVGSLVALRAGGQDPNNVETRLESQVLDRVLPDGRVERLTVQVPVETTERSTIIEQRPDGVVVERTVDGKVLRMQKGLPGLPPGVTQAVTDGRSVSVLSLGPQPLDAESQKLLADEQALAQEVRKLSTNLLSIDMPAEKEAEQKKAIREKLAAIFDLQQQRRTREIAKIEERLGKLKDVLKKRESAKDSIVDRRLESITGGVDELGWEESLAPSAYQGPAFGPRLAPGTQPSFDSPVPVPPSVGPADYPPTIPGPNAVVPPAALPPPAPSAPSNIPAPSRIPAAAPSDDAPATTLQTR